MMVRIDRTGEGVDLTFEVLTQKGSREINEDSIYANYANNKGLFVVADGLGGHGKGDIASSLAVTTFKGVFETHTGPLSELFSSAFSQAQSAILSEQAQTGSPFQMKTTVCALAVDGEDMMWAHIGDTRLYAFSRNKAKIRTLDHSVPQMLALAHDIKERDIRNHPDRNRLLRVLGISGETPRFDVSELQRSSRYQAFLLCSDGFWELILEKEMGTALKKSTSAADWLNRMKKIVETRGSGTDMDNYSAIAIWM